MGPGYRLGTRDGGSRKSPLYRYSWVTILSRVRGGSDPPRQTPAPSFSIAGEGGSFGVTQNILAQERSSGAEKGTLYARDIRV